MIRRGVVLAYSAGVATVQLAGDVANSVDVEVATGITPTVGQECAVAFFGDGSNPDDAVLLAVWS